MLTYAAGAEECGDGEGRGRFATGAPGLTDHRAVQRHLPGAEEEGGEVTGMGGGRWFKWGEQL